MFLDKESRMNFAKKSPSLVSFQFEKNVKAANVSKSTNEITKVKSRTSLLAFENVFCFAFIIL